MSKHNVQNLAFRHLTIFLQFQAELPQVEIGGDGGNDSGLMRSVSHYRKQKPVVKIVRNVEFIENEPTGKYILEPIILETIWGPVWGSICDPIWGPIWGPIWVRFGVRSGI